MEEEEEEEDIHAYYSAEEERERLEAFFRREMRSFDHPFQVKRCSGNRVSLKFQVPDPGRIYNLLRKFARRNGCSRMMHIDSSSASELILKRTEKHDINQKREDEQRVDHKAALDVSLVFYKDNAESPVIELVKHGRFSSMELRVALSTLQIDRNLAWVQAQSLKETVDVLEEMCVSVNLGEDCIPGIAYSKGAILWNKIAGYKEQKREIENVLALPLNCSKVYDSVANGTRGTFKPIPPRTILFEGPPGTGKTQCALAIGNSGIPLLRLSLELSISKYDKQCGKMLAKVFSVADDLPIESLIIFVDKVESLTRNRDCVTNEIASGVLSVLLHQMSGVERSKKISIIVATNCKEDLDPHFIRRFNHIITFGLPDERNRIEVIYHYAKHLTELEVRRLARATYGMSGKDILSVCQHARRRTRAMKSARGWDYFPNIDEYLESAQVERNIMSEDHSQSKRKQFEIE